MERTLCIIKPDAVRRNNVGNIISMIQSAGFTILGLKQITISPKVAGEFYAVHRERPFYAELVNFMSGGSIVPIALQKNNAVADWRTLIGATDPAEAEEGTIRKLYAANKGENAVHGSDSIENGRIEVAFFFSELELIG
ncbi:MAG: nucleoside-diphosphate kinase [Ignavibacteria bacterium]|nr:nucleoside-diphosphate kinase [Ignavibacteria bacterium]